MRTLGAVLAAVSLPLGLLNLFGGIISGIWLAFLGEWSVIFSGLAIVLGGSFAAALLLMPGIGLATIGMTAVERGNNAVGWFFIALASPWTCMVIIFWEVSVFWFFGRRVTPDNAIPMWLWTYGAATGVWAYLASKEQHGGGGDGAAVQAFAAQVAFIVLSVCMIFLGWPLMSSVVAMAIPLILPLLFGLMMFGAERRQI